jgi:hypothetical protein
MSASHSLVNVGRARSKSPLSAHCLRLAQEATSDPARQKYTALAYTWTELANVFESGSALVESLSAAGLSAVPRRPIRLRAA